MIHISIISVFLAGVVMFLAPCTLPLLPAYLGYISGVTQEEIVGGVTSARARRLILVHALLFVLGFSLVFIVLGLLAGMFGRVFALVHGPMVFVSGVVSILFGLFMVGVLKLPFLTRERRVRVPAFLTLGTPPASFVLGAVFAAGWTPCVGPLLAAVFVYASAAETALVGLLYLVVFSFGFSVPLLVLALLFGQASRFVERAAPYLRAVSVLGGIALIIIGLYLVFGDTFLSRWFYGLFDHLDFQSLVSRFQS